MTERHIVPSPLLLKAKKSIVFIRILYVNIHTVWCRYVCALCSVWGCAVPGCNKTYMYGTELQRYSISFSMYTALKHLYDIGSDGILGCCFLGQIFVYNFQDARLTLATGFAFACFRSWSCGSDS